VGQIERCFTSRESAAPYWRRAVELDANQDEAFQAVAAFYKQTHATQDLLQLHQIRLKDAKANNQAGIVSMLSKQGEDLMNLGRYADAATAFGESMGNGRRRF
jgi:hypothetical protein